MTEENEKAMTLQETIDDIMSRVSGEITPAVKAMQAAIIEDAYDSGLAAGRSLKPLANLAQAEGRDKLVFLLGNIVHQMMMASEMMRDGSYGEEAAGHGEELSGAADLCRGWLQGIMGE